MKRTLLLIVFGLSAQLCAGQAYWRAANGPYGGTIISALTTSSDGTVYAASVGGIFRSDDEGMTWTPDMDGVTAAGVDVRALLELSDGMLVASTYGGGVFRRAPGDVWRRSDTQHAFTTSITEAPDGTLYAGTIQGILRSTNRGASWTAYGVGERIQIVTAVAANEDYVFASTSLGVYRSADGGMTWEYASMGMTTFDTEMLFLASNGDLYVGTSPITGGCTLFRTRSSGRLWTCAQPGSSPVVSRSMTEDATGRLYLGGYRNVYWSDDEGNRWTATAVGSTTVHALTATGSTVLAGLFGRGMLRSINRATTWDSANDGLYSAVTDLAIGADGTTYAATLGGVFASGDMGATWTLLDDMDAQVRPSYSILLDEFGRVLDGTRNGVFRYDPSQDQWDELGPPGNPSVRDMKFGPDGSLYVGYWEGVYHLRGQNWTSYPLLGPDQTTRDVLAVEVGDDGTLFAGGAYDSFKREVGATGWVRLSSYVSPYFEAQVFTAGPDGGLYAGTRYFGIMVSRDGGRNWSPMSESTVTLDVRAISFDRSGLIHIGTFGDGIKRFNRWSRQWDPFNTGMEHALRVTSLTFDDGGNAFAGTFGAGVFVHASTATGTDRPTQPERASFGAPFPNPASSSFQMEGSPAASPVSVQVFDLLGRRLLSRNYPAGTARIRVEADGLAPGMYQVRVVTGRGVSHHPVIVSR